MDRATSARTRAELDPLVADLPVPAGTAVAESAPAAPSWHIRPVGGLRVYRPWRMDRHVVVLSLVGGARLDLSQPELAAKEVTLTKVSLVGGTRLRVPPGVRVESGRWGCLFRARRGGRALVGWTILVCIERKDDRVPRTSHHRVPRP
jgi:hypothetical protein